LVREYEPTDHVDGLVGGVEVSLTTTDLTYLVFDDPSAATTWFEQARALTQQPKPWTPVAGQSFCTAPGVRNAKGAAIVRCWAVLGRVGLTVPGPNTDGVINVSHKLVGAALSHLLHLDDA
jgi:hypothetical protein